MTLYHGNMNYGAVLQAYALCKKINDLGFECEQIDYAYMHSSSLLRSKIKMLFDYKKVVGYIRRNKGHGKVAELLKNREKRFTAFKEAYIPTSVLYTDETIKNAINKYDVFVVGSDQVWNPDWLKKEMLLDFVPESKKKISYAASIGKYILTNEQEEMFRKHLESFTAVSVRENESVELLGKCYDGEIVCTVDPTLLLDEQEWDDIAANSLVEEEYVFCYFLSENLQQRELAKEYAHKNNCKLVTIPHAYRYNFCDVDFSDIDYVQASPKEFLSLIKNAECIFTDSFHACVFSGLYKKQFFVFSREDSQAMNVRIEEILSIYEAREHFISSMEGRTVQDLETIAPIKYKDESELLEERRNKSIEFLKNTLNG